MSLSLINSYAAKTAQKPAISVGLETRYDVIARESLLDAAFGAARFEKTCERLRTGRMHADGLGFTATDKSKLVGTIRLWKVMAGGVPALLLGPLAVAKSHEGLGIGSKLIRHALFEASKLGHQAVILVGDAPYYERFGFTRDLTDNLVLPGPVERERFLALELVDGALDGAMGLVIATGQKATSNQISSRSSMLKRKIA
jgi:predicted N-acetyltransferase YhbS